MGFGGGVGLGAAVMVITNGGSEALFEPLVTVIVISAVSPTSLLAGVPVICPVFVSNRTQPGFPAISNVRAWPLGSDAVGWNMYMSPACTDAGGVPLMTGAEGSGTTVFGCVMSAVGGELEPALQAASATAMNKEAASDPHLPNRSCERALI